ncbi:MAG: GHKL domain-containing protein [Ruminococcaceae bacterium]|nr:GHKL domain-containing protein [Oscillospiraceae bacterium]
MIFFEFAVSLFDALICVYFISRFNGIALSPKKNKFILPSIAIIFAFSIINDLFLEGFNVVGTIVFLSLYIGYALLTSGKKYIRAILGACIFEIVFVILSSLLYLIITFIIKDYDALLQGEGGVFRYAYVIIHKIVLFVVLKLILMYFKSSEFIDIRHGVIAFLFSFATILGLGSTMYIASIVDAGKIQVQTMIIALAFAFANVALYVLIFQLQKYQQSKYQLKLLEEKIAFDEARHNDASAIWQSIRRVQHDMKQHMAVISGYLDDQSIDGAKRYINELAPSVDSMGTLLSSDNRVLDYLINSKLAPLSDTKIVISGSIGNLSDIKETDLACLIGNILDNAISALAEVGKTSEKRLELLFMRQNSNRIIICKNTIERSVLKSNRELETTKASSDAHGYGTKIIAKIVSDYNGMVDYFEEFNMFGVQVVLPEPNINL